MMKKAICLLAVLVLCISLAVPAFAAEEEFVPSISYKGSPRLVSAAMNDENTKDCIVITSISQAKDKSTDIAQDERDLLLEVYGKLEDGSMTLPLKSGYVIRELVDINFKYNHCRVVDSHNQKDEELAKDDIQVTITLNLGIAKNVKLEVLQYKNNEWSAVEAKNNGDGTVTMVFEHFCPVAFAVYDNISDSDLPLTGDVAGQNLGLWIGLMVVAAAGLAAVVVISRKKKK